MATAIRNQKATFDYEILEKWEAGLVLLGLEVKSLKSGRGASLAGSYISFENGEAYLVGATIAPYQPGNTPEDYKPERRRKLLLNEKELKELEQKTNERGLTIIPLSLYSKRNQLKLEIGLARGKKTRDKRETIKKREAKRQIERSLKS